MLLATLNHQRCRPLFPLRKFLYDSFTCSSSLERVLTTGSTCRKSSGFSKAPSFERLELLHPKESQKNECEDKTGGSQKPSKLKSWSLLTPAFCKVIVTEVSRRSCSHDMKFLTKVLHDTITRPSASDITSNDGDIHKALQASLKRDKSHITLTSLVANGRHEMRWFYALILDLLRGKKLSKVGFSKTFRGLVDPDIAAAHQKLVFALQRYKRKSQNEFEVEEKQIKVAGEQLSLSVPAKTIFQLIKILDTNANQKKGLNEDKILKIMDMHAEILLLSNVRDILGLSLSEKSIEFIEETKSEKYALCSKLSVELEDFAIRVQDYRHFFESFPEAVPSVTSFVKQASIQRSNSIPKAIFQYNRDATSTDNGYDMELLDGPIGHDKVDLLPIRRVFIDNLPLTATADIIRETFCRCGPVSHVQFYAAHDDFNLEDENSFISKTVSKEISDVISAERISEETTSEEFDIEDYDENVDGPVSQSLQPVFNSSLQELCHIDKAKFIPINDIAKNKKRKNLLAIERGDNKVLLLTVTSICKE
jgi:hypothetical protein